MKKTVLFIVILLLLFGFRVFAENGSIVGNIYSTDILTYVNQKPIQGYNIGGRTVVIAEELDGYGFYVEYSDELRKLSVFSDFTVGEINPEEIQRGQVGKILGNIYATDIQTYYNGILVQGYNIGGKTAVCLEDLGELTDSPNGMHGYSDYLGKALWDADNRIISFESYLKNENSILGLSKVYHRFKDNVIYTFSDDFYPRSEFSAEVNEEYTGKYTYSSALGSTKYLIKPLYFDNHGEQIVIGTVVQNPNNSQNEALMHIENPEMVLQMIQTYKAPTKTHDEAKAYFSQNYEVIKEIENKFYTVMMVEKDTDGLLMIYINKQGGFVIDRFLDNYKNGELDIWFEESSENAGVNTVIHSVYPFGGPHGTITAHFPIDLDLYDYQ